MEFRLTDEDHAIKERAKAFTEQHLYPLELEADRNEAISDEAKAALKDAINASELNAVNHAREHGGQGMTMVQQCIVNEEVGKATNGLWAYVWMPPLPLKDGTRDQIEDFLIPGCRGDAGFAYCITEEGAGSDVSYVKTTAVLDGNHYVINGGKWFASGADECEYTLLHAHVDGDPERSAVFIVERDQPGFNVARMPRFMMSDVDRHPEMEISNLRVQADRMLGAVGEGFDLTKDWFVEARLAIAARCCGMAVRAAEEANAYVSEREQFGARLNTLQGVEFMLADMAVSIMAAKSLLYRVAAEIDAGADRKRIHALASAAKLHCSESCGKVVDMAVQLHGGRGVSRDYPVERLYRGIRVERIWEGASEVQKAIIAGQIRKRGLDVYAGLA
ncbi:MAG: acyl-CoA dehydrogenase [Pseudomonadota bacterium]